MSVDLKRIVEALLFVAESPVSLAQLAQSMGSGDKEALAAALDELRQEYQTLGRSFELVEVAGGWAFRTRPDLAHWLRDMRKDQTTRLSRPALETLAIIAYKQPVLKADIERLRGVEVGGVLRMLMEKDLVRVAGRRDLPGRPLIYGTTRRFLEVFDLKDLNDLPTLEEMEALAGPTDTLPLGRHDDEPGDYSMAQAPLDEREQDQDQDEMPSWEALEPSQAAPEESRDNELQGDPGDAPALMLEQPARAPESDDDPEADDPQEPWSEDADCDPPPEKDPPAEGTVTPPFSPEGEN